MLESAEVSRFVIHHEQRVRKSQFEHVASLVAKAKKRAEGLPTWVCFSDDDDLWSERRFDILTRAARSASSQVATLCCRRKARPTASVTASTAPRDAVSVRALLTSGTASLTDSSKREASKRKEGFGEVGSEHFHMSEWFDYVCRFDTLAAWIRRCPQPVLAHKLCDLAFTYSLRQDSHERARLEHFMPRGAAINDFVYYYGTALGAASASQHAAVGADERALAYDLLRAGRAEQQARKGHAAALDAIGALYGGADAAGDTDAAAAAMARFLADLRQHLEMELVQTRLGGHIVPTQIIESVCHRQVDVLLMDQGAAAKLGGERTATLNAWAYGVARDDVTPRLLSELQFDALVCWDEMRVTHLINEARTESEVMMEVMKEHVPADELALPE